MNIMKINDWRKLNGLQPIATTVKAKPTAPQRPRTHAEAGRAALLDKRRAEAKSSRGTAPLPTRA